MSLASTPEIGQLVQVRQRQFIVTDVVGSSLPDRPIKTTSNGAQHLVSLTSIEDDALGEELQVIWELEPGARVIEQAALPEADGLDSPERLDAFLDAVRWGASSSADTRSVQSPFRSGIDIEDYQLDPVVRAIQMPRVNLLLADDVGLGKTIEAGLVILELIFRHRARKVLIICPASLCVQWKDQMRDKFGLEFRIVDSNLMRELRRKRGIHANPWAHFPRLITSVDYLKRERPLRLFRETLPAEGESIYPRRYDILVLDEAHNCAPSGRGKYATDSLRTKCLRTLAPHFEHKLFLTATPHNGYIESFSALLELLDNMRFPRGTAPDKRQLDAVMVRRLKSELPPHFDGTPRFAKRVLHALEVPYTDAEKAVHSALQEYTQLRRKDVSDNTERVASEFVMKTLKKRLFSSPAAFATTLKKHEESLVSATRKKGPRKPTVKILQRQIDLVDEDYADDDELEEVTADAVDVATRLFRDSNEEEKALLKKMKEWAGALSVVPDSKAELLLQWLKDSLMPGGQWNDERVIIFTEYRATQTWLQTILATAGLTKGDRLLTMHGGMDSQTRETIKAAFQAHPSHSPVRILLATDSASEGIDLQNHCSRLIHFEIPWNPNRMEQRNGRVDRYGQKAKQVDVFHFVGEGYNDRQQTGQETAPGDLAGDLEFLLVAARKVNAIREDLGKVGPVIASQVEEAMLGIRTRLDTERAEQEGDSVRKMLKFERDLHQRIQELRDQLDETRRELRLSPENIQKVVEIALELAGQPPLIPVQVPGKDPDAPEVTAATLPALRGSWARCADGLQHPHTGEVRPITFDHHVAQGRDDIVLAHLNHRLVQMSLRLLRAEVWSREGTKRLHRVTARLVPDPFLQDPVVIAHARLVVVGGDSHRLHEEIITAGGRLREGRFARMNVGEIKDALAAAQASEPSEEMKDRLVAMYEKHEESLRSSLEARMKDRTGGMARALADREKKEIADITAILTELQKMIRTKLDDPELKQLQFEGWAEDERYQLERNMDALRHRLTEIPGDIERESESIRLRFSDPQPRMFPVAVTILVPEKLCNG